MTKLLISTALAGLLAASGAAFAQDDHHHDHGGPAPAAHAGPPPSAPHAPAPSAPRGPAPAMHHDDHHDDHRGGPGPAAAFTGRPDRFNNGSRPPAAAPAGRPDDRHFNGPGPGAAPHFAPGGNRNFGSRPDFSNWHRNFTAPRRFRAPDYRRPYGWYSHRWAFGEILPSLFWAPDYWINDFYDFGLAPPPPGTVWVRDGADALLIDRYSGEIIQVEYGVFY